MIAASIIAIFVAVVPESNGNVVTTTVQGRDIHITDTIYHADLHTRDNFGTLRNGVRTIHANPGGYIYAADALVKRGNTRGEQVRLMCEGGCISAATQFLGAKNVCIGRHAWFGFHAATKTVLGFVKDKEATETMAASYPPALRAMFLRKWQNRWGMSYYHIRGAQVRNLTGIGVCK